MVESENQMPDGTKQLHDYAAVRGLVADKKYDEALTQVKGSALNDSTREQLQMALESGDEYIITRTFSELDARIMQALCWDCWRD